MKNIPTSPSSLVSPDTISPLPPLDNDEAAIGSLSRDPSDPAADRGGQKPTFEGDDEQEAAERLVNRGVEEASEDLARAARTRHAF